MKVVGCCSDCGGVGREGYIRPGWPICCWACWDSGKSKDWILWWEAPRMAAKCVGEVGRLRPRGLWGEVWCIICCCWGEVTPGGERVCWDWTDWGGDIMGGDMWGLYVMLAGMDCCLPCTA